MSAGRTVRKAVRGLVKALLFPIRFIPQSAFKEHVKVLLVKLHSRLPFYLMVNSGDTVIQVGTPNASTLESYSKYVGPSGRVVIVEPEPANLEVLKDALMKLPHANAVVVPKGAWSERARLSFCISPNKEDHKIAVEGVLHDNDLAPENAEYGCIEIDADTIDNIVRDLGIGHVDFMNITVNGAEHEVLKGATETLGMRPQRLWVKAHALTAGGVPLNRLIIPMLEGYGFRAYKTAGQPAVGSDRNWRVRDGDVYAFKL